MVSPSNTISCLNTNIILLYHYGIWIPLSCKILYFFIYLVYLFLFPSQLGHPAAFYLGFQHCPSRTRVDVKKDEVCKIIIITIIIIINRGPEKNVYHAHCTLYGIRKTHVIINKQKCDYSESKWVRNRSLYVSITTVVCGVSKHCCNNIIICRPTNYYYYYYYSCY